MSRSCRRPSEHSPGGCSSSAARDSRRLINLLNNHLPLANLRCKHGWRSHLTARPKVLRRRQFKLSPKASSSAHSVAAGPVKVDHPVVPRRIERPGVLESAMPTASCVSLCESCGLMMNPASKVGARGGNTQILVVLISCGRPAYRPEPTSNQAKQDLDYLSPSPQRTSLQNLYLRN
jgi:hypothetical protein